MASSMKRLSFCSAVPEQQPTPFNCCLVHAPNYDGKRHPYEDNITFSHKHLYVKKLATIRRDRTLGMCVKILYIGTQKECLKYKSDLSRNEKPSYRRNSV